MMLSVIFEVSIPQRVPVVKDHPSIEKINIAAPNTTSTTPVARLSVLGEALLANLAAILAHSRVKTIHKTIIGILGSPPIAKWDTAPVKAVKVMIKTLVPTAVFSSYPRIEVRMSSIIIPPPAPIKPQIKPIKIPQITD